jgi:hypothetical protein
MTREPDFDETLRRGFQGLKDGDARATPDFALMLARARAATTAAPAAPRRRMWSGRRLLFFGAPLAAAATLAIWLRPTSAADREFEQAVSAWTRTAAQTALSPTDGLLSVPGTEFLRGTPAVGTDGRTPRRGS